MCDTNIFNQLSLSMTTNIHKHGQYTLEITEGCQLLVQWNLLIRSIENMDTSIIHTIVMSQKLYYAEWLRKSGHLDNLDTYHWFQWVYYTGSTILVSLNIAHFYKLQFEIFTHFIGFADSKDITNNTLCPKKISEFCTHHQY